MSLLNRFLIQQNLFLIAIILLVGVGIYVLTDLFELLDRFLESNLSFATIGWYYFIKTPTIIAQLLPAIFLISLVVQLNILERNKELMALYAGGISPLVLLRFILFYALFWACIQFVFSEALGVTGEREARKIWKEQVQQRSLNKEEVKNLWFIHKNNIVHVGSALPREKTGNTLRLYVLDDSRIQLQEIITAEKFTISDKEWVLLDVSKITMQPTQRVDLAEITFPIRQDLQAFLLVESWSKPEQLPLWELGTVMKRLKKAGSNTESLQTAWHAKISYAASIFVMGILALVILQWTNNIYKAVGISLIVIFLYYSINTISITLGQSGSMPPMLAAWVTNVSSFIILVVCLFWPNLKEYLARIHKQ